MNLDRDGAQLFRSVLSEHQLEALKLSLSAYDLGGPGVRLGDVHVLRPWTDPAGAIGAIATRLAGCDTRVVRAILFEKSADANWTLGWHQDRTVAVSERVEADGYGPWTIKHGIHHVEPPFEIIERMLTLRLHLDPVEDDNAPLLISPGTHRLGRIPEGMIDEVVRDHGVRTCLAQAGDVWAYRTPILHASRKSVSGGGRRVLQLDYSAGGLPHPLRWALTT